MRWPTADEWRDISQRSYPPGLDPSWIEYIDAPPQLANRTRFERTLECCETIWNETRDNAIVGVAMAWTDVHCQFLRPWLQQAVQEMLASELPLSEQTASARRIIDLLPPSSRAELKTRFTKAH
jgi:hypothetical protein